MVPELPPHNPNPTPNWVRSRLPMVPLPPYQLCRQCWLLDGELPGGYGVHLRLLPLALYLSILQGLSSFEPIQTQHHPNAFYLPQQHSNAFLTPTASPSLYLSVCLPLCLSMSIFL